MPDSSFTVDTQALRQHANSTVQTQIEQARAAGSRLAAAGEPTTTPMLISEVGPKVDEAVLKLEDAIKQLMRGEEDHQILLEKSAQAYEAVEQSNQQAAGQIDVQGAV